MMSKTTTESVAYQKKVKQIPVFSQEGKKKRLSILNEQDSPTQKT